MNPYMEEVYNYLEDIEEKKEQLRRKMSRGKVGGDDMSTYASYTRQACNFVFPNISGNINGEKRPRPGMFKLSTKEGLVVDEGKNKSKIEKYKKSDPSVVEYIKAIREFIYMVLKCYI